MDRDQDKTNELLKLKLINRRIVETDDGFVVVEHRFYKQWKRRVVAKFNIRSFSADTVMADVQVPCFGHSNNRLLIPRRGNVLVVRANVPMNFLHVNRKAVRETLLEISDKRKFELCTNTANVIVDFMFGLQ